MRRNEAKLPEMYKVRRFMRWLFKASRPASSAKKRLLPSHSCPLHIPILPMTALFRDQEECQYWLYFRDEGAHDLAGHAPTKC